MSHKPTSLTAPRPRVVSSEHLALGRIVRELRARRTLSQEELGFRASLHRNYVGAIERGEINPTFRTLLALAHGLDVRLSSLLHLCELRQSHIGSAHGPCSQRSARAGTDRPPRAEARGGSCGEETPLRSSCR